MRIASPEISQPKTSTVFAARLCPSARHSRWSIARNDLMASRPISLEDLLDGSHGLVDRAAPGARLGEPQAHLRGLAGHDFHLAHLGAEARMRDPQPVRALLELAPRLPPRLPASAWSPPHS